MRRSEPQWGTGDRAAAAGQLPGVAAGRGAASDALASSGAAVSKAIAASRSSGTLSLAGRGLSEVPPAVYRTDGADASGGVAWWEVQELSRLDLSRNEIARLPEELFAACSALTSLDLSLNKLSCLPPGLGQLEQLRSLALSRNPLGAAAAAPGAASGGALAASRSFSRSAGPAAGRPSAAPGGAGAGLPEDTARLPALASLACADCRLTSLPEGLGDARAQPALAQLLASGNRLAALPLGLARASALVKLELQGNALTELDGRMVVGWAALKELDLSNNQLRALPGELGSLLRLEVLRVRQNQLEVLPPGLGSAAALAELHAGFNRLTALPDSLGGLPRLAVLDVRNNRIADFPAALCRLPLTLLDLSSNDLQSLPSELGAMTTLRALPLDGNPLKRIRRELWSGPISALLEHLRSRAPEPAAAQQAARSDPFPAAARPASRGNSGAQTSFGTGRPISSGGGGAQLVLRTARLSALPPELSDASAAARLTRVDLGGNPGLGPVLDRGAALPPLPHLQHLDLSACGVTRWPLPLCSTGEAMPALKALVLHGNLLQQVPRGALSSCPNLLSLDLSGCPASALDALPAGVLPPRLEVLAMAGCRLLRAPWEPLAAVAATLRELDLSSNNLCDLPPLAASFTRLEMLDLNNNALTALPFELGRLAPSRGGALRTLRVQGNCIRTVRRPLLEGGSAALLEYLASRLPDAA